MHYNGQVCSSTEKMDTKEDCKNENGRNQTVPFLLVPRHPASSPPVAHVAKVHRPNRFPEKNVIMFFHQHLAVFRGPTGWPASRTVGDQYAVQPMTAASRAIRSGLTLSKVSTAEWCVYLYSGGILVSC